jgi:hypothetical protein
MYQQQQGRGRIVKREKARSSEKLAEHIHIHHVCTNPRASVY